MKCQFCGNQDTRVIDTRPTEEGVAIRRRRLCDKCGKKFTTFEYAYNIPLMVIKRDGTRENFERNKILNGIVMSCNKRPITFGQIEGVVADIENNISSLMLKEVQSKQIGELVMQKLKLLDEVAYVRFASVYKQFKDIDTFFKELADLKTEKGKGH
ncbi:MAG: transcriptional regulator NrdR [Clostridiales bacterium]|jgi:transcriptional repressor NrdR|nr:transcriptional regulator NrdR [Clostridiales bacterium]